MPSSPGPTLNGGTLPILERIRQNLLATVAQISTASGYQTNFVALEPDRRGEPITDGITLTVDVLLGSAEWNRELQCNNLIEWVQEFLFVYTCSQAAVPGQAVIPADQLVILARSDIEKALDADPHRGGLAANTTPAPPTWFERQTGEHEGGVVRRYVVYRTQWTDPYTFRA